MADLKFHSRTRSQRQGTKPRRKSEKQAIKRQQTDAETRRQQGSGQRLSPGANTRVKQQTGKEPNKTNKYGRKLSAPQRQQVRERSLTDLYSGKRRLAPQPKPTRVYAPADQRQAELDFGDYLTGRGKAPTRRSKLVSPEGTTPATVSNRHDRDQMMKAARSTSGRSPAEKFARGLGGVIEEATTRLYNNVAHPRGVGAGEVKGFGGPSDAQIKNLGRLFAYEIPKEYVNDPGLLGKDAKLVGDTIKGGAGALIHGVDVGTLWQGIKDDYETRYGEALKTHPDWKKVDKVIREKGGLVYGLDVPLPAATLSKTGGKLAKSGALGVRAAEYANAARPLLRYGDGLGDIKMQVDETRKASPSLLRIATQRKSDARRAKKYGKEVRRNTAAGRATMGVGRGEVAARTGGRYAERTRLQRHAGASTKSRLNVTLHARQEAELGDFSKALRHLSKREQAAVTYLVDGTVDPTNPIPGLKDLLKHKTDYRKEKGYKGRPLEYDERRIIQKLIDDPESAFTTRAIDLAEEHKGIEQRLAVRDPGVDEVQAEMRREAKRGILYGITHPQKFREELEANFDKANRRLQEAEHQFAEARQAVVVAERKHIATPGEHGAWADKEYRQAKVAEGVAEDNLTEARVHFESAATQHETANLPEQIAADNKAYLDAIRAEAKNRGHAEKGGYFAGRAGFAEFAPGGSRASHQVKKPFTGESFRLGREVRDPSALVSSLATQIKRDVQWNGITDAIVAHVHPKYAGKNGKGMPINTLKREVERDGLDVGVKGDKAIWSPELAEQNLVGDAFDKLDELDVPGTDLNPSQVAAEALNDGVVDLAKAFDKSGKLKPEFAHVNAYVVDRALLEEVMPNVISSSSQRMFSKMSRTYNIGKSTVSRGMFFLNAPWMMANIASNAMIAGVGPVDFIQAQKWWHALPKETQVRLMPYAQVEARTMQLMKPQMGAAGGWLTEAGQALRQTPLGRHRPLSGSVDWWLQTEQKLANHGFFIGKLYKEMKNDKRFHNLDNAASQANQIMDRIVKETSVPNPLDLSSLSKKATADDLARAESLRKRIISDRNSDVYVETSKLEADLSAIHAKYGGVPTVKEQRTQHITRQAPEISLDRFTDIKKLDGPDAAQFIRANQVALEHYAERVSTALGDFTTMTQAQRAIVGRIMFYPWIRFSLKFTFKTMPLEHPVIAATVAKMTDLNRQELEQIFGEEVSREDMSKFKLWGKTFDSRRLNPAGNLISELGDPSGIFGGAPPFISTGLALIQGARSGNYGPQPLDFDGKNTPPGEAPNRSVPNVAQMIFADLLDVPYLTRTINRAGQRGKEGDDSFVGHRERIQAKDPKARAFNNRQIKIDQERNANLYKIFQNALSGGVMPNEDQMKLNRDRGRAYSKKGKKGTVTAPKPGGQSLTEKYAKSQTQSLTEKWAGK